MQHTKIVFLILPHVHLLDLAGPDQVFNEAKGLGANLVIEYCSVEKNIATSAHLNIHQLPMFSEVNFNKGDYLFVPGADVGFLTAKQFPFEKQLSNWIKDLHQRGIFICSICTGSFFLARMGLLNHKQCTTHWKRTAELKKRFPKIKLTENILFTEDDGVYTSAGVTAGIDMALYIIEQLTDDHFSFKVARELVVYMRRQGKELQESVFMNYRNHIHAGVHSVQDYIQQNIQQRLSLSELADLAFMSSRNLTRIFKKETGTTINEYISLIRKEYLRGLLKNPDLTRKQMATMCGLKSERQIIRLLKEVL